MIEKVKVYEEGVSERTAVHVLTFSKDIVMAFAMLYEFSFGYEKEQKKGDNTKVIFCWVVVEMA